MIAKYAFLLPLLLSLSCATSYQPVSYSGGYAESEAPKNVFLVCFQGNGYSSLSNVKEKMFRRCSEVCKEKGFKGYKIVDGPIENSFFNAKDDLNDYGDKIPESVACPAEMGRHFAAPSASVLIRCQNPK
ncbi:MAG: hypothetical protein EOP04_19920 [Proteobacteria bacterium]|nr:MAG: hypothetical protein EOP04_19920 [Pseudomonadota bacterium]